MATDIIHKCGVGKTTTAQPLGIGLANKGFKVLFVDLDGQCNLSYILAVKQYCNKDLSIIGILLTR